LFRNVLRRGVVERRLDAEVRAYFELLVDEKIAAGLSPDDAHRAARLEIEGVEQVKERVRDGRAGAWLDHLARDLAFALRSHAKTPGATAIIVATLALGIAATSISFSLINGFFIRPLPIGRPERFVRLYNSYKQGDPYFTFSYPDFADMRALDGVFEDAAAEMPEPFAIALTGAPERVWGQLVSERYFQTLGVQPALGRFFARNEDAADGGDAVVVLGHGLWTRFFGGRRDIVGERVLVDGRSFQIIGVAPERFGGTTLGFVSDLWIPSAAERRVRFDEARTQRNLRGWFGMARLRPGVGVGEARAALDTLARRLQREYPSSNAGVGFTALPESEGRIFPLLRGSILTGSLVTVVVAVLVLVITCANVAGLLLVRASARRAEIAVRLALGASRGRIIAQLLTESALLTIAAGAAGLALSWKLTEFMTAVQVTIARGTPARIDVSIDGKVLAISLLVVAGTGVLFSLLPALETSRPDLVAALKDTPGSSGRARGTSRRLLVAVQIAISMVLLAGGGLFLRSLQNARHIDLGFEPDHVVETSLDVRLHQYPRAVLEMFWQQVLAGVRGVAGVESASLAARLPLDLGLTRISLGPEGFHVAAEQAWPLAEFARVDTDYFRTLRIPLLEGRDFSERDGPQSPDVIIVNDVVAHLFWPGAASVVGRHVVGPTGGRFEVVGVARRSKYFSIGEDPRPYVYLPLRQGAARALTIVARVSGDPAVYVRAIAAKVRELEPVAPVFDTATMSQRVALSMAPVSGGATVLGIVGVLALILTSLGLYGIVAQTVNRRTYEIGVRRALGAQDRDIARLVVGQALAVVAIGIAAGLAAGLGSARLMRTLLIAVDAADPLVFGVAPLVLLAVCAAAAWLPTRRAVRISAATALRYE
jgi:predicted permease